jgi:tetratricopeptide (TPR) repeat protein
MRSIRPSIFGSVAVAFAPGAALLLGGCAGSAAGEGARPPLAPPTQVQVPTQILSASTDGTERELFARGERALLAQNWREAADDFETLLASRPDLALVPTATFNLGLAYEGLGQRTKARDRYHEVAANPSAHSTSLARTSLLRAVAVHAYLEEWKELGETANVLLARTDIDPVDRLTGLGARGLSKIELGDDTGASIDVQNGLDIVDELHYGSGGRLQPPGAQLRFAQAEVRRVRSEKIRFVPDEIPSAQAVPPDFLAKMEARCQGLLDAQGSYADAMRSTDPHWIAMAGFRVGEMYRKLHHDLMVIPPTLLAKTDKQKQIFFAIMHVRYRVLLEKGLEMMKRTLELGEKQLDSSSWVRRAQAARVDIELAIDEERAVLKTFPFTEEEIQGALDILKAKAEKKRLADEKALEARETKERASH